MNHRHLVFAVLLCCGAFLLGGCSRKRVHASNPAQTPPAQPSPVQPSATPLIEETTGYASWYGHPYHGRRTTNGETYDMNTMTAAHRTLPFDTVVKVTNLSNGKTVTVRINDRGPFVKDRIIDLSYIAAKQIDMVGPGTARVNIEILKSVPNPFPLAIQVASFKEEVKAKKLQTDLKERFAPVALQEYESSEGTFFRVLVGQFKDSQEAQAALKMLRRENLDGFMVRLDK
jgi:rare lipoprotein A